METYKFPGRFDSLPRIGEIVVKAAKRAELDDQDVYAVQLAVDEACCNIIDHAYGGEGKGEMLLSIGIEEDGLRIVLRDDGRAFDPGRVPKPQIDVPLEDLKPRGIGLHLITKMMDEIHYESSPETGNILTMFKRRT